MERSTLFAVGLGPGELEVFDLRAGRESLHQAVTRLRSFIRPGQDVDTIRFLAAQLTTTLLAPAAGRIAAAERLLILPDGPLHSLPFAVLLDPGSGKQSRYLVEAKPLAVAASATVFAELKKRRRDRAEVWVSAFGNPEYPGAAAREQAGAIVRASLESGLRLDPLPASVAEVESL